MVCLMKTTIELPDALLADVRRVAAEQGTTMRELMIEGLRGEIERRTSGQPKVDFVFPVSTVAGTGLAPGVRPEDMIEMSYGDRG